MKNRFIRFVSSVLIIAFLISCFAVLSYADTSDVGESSAESDASLGGITLLINRTFGEGWGCDNGFNLSDGGHKFSVEYEQTEDYDYNYYTRVEGTSQDEGYMELSYGANGANYGYTIMEFDVKTDDSTNIGDIVYTHRKESGSINYRYPLASIKNNNLYLVGAGTVSVSGVTNNKNMNGTASSPSYLVGGTDDEWIHVAFVTTVNQRVCPTCGTVSTVAAGTLDSAVICCADEEGKGISVSGMGKCMTMTVYFGYSDTFNIEGAKKANSLGGKEKDLNATYYYTVTFEEISTFDYYRMGMPLSGKNNFGASVCFDNVSLYNGASVPTDISSLGYGVNVNELAAKTIEIVGGSKTATQYINEGLAMKVGVDSCLDAGEKRSILTSKEGKSYGAPVKIDGKVYVPLQAVLDWVGYPLYQHEDGVSFDISTASGSTFIGIGRTLATSNGELIQLTAAPGLATDAETGLQYIVVALDDIEILFEGYHVTYDDMGLVIVAEAPDLLNRETDLNLMLNIMKRFIYDDVEGNNVYNQVKANTNNFEHPYLIATQADFDSISSSEDANVKAYTAAVKAEADAIYAEYTAPKTDEAGNPIAKKYPYLAAEIINPNTLLEEDYLNNGYDYAVGRLNESGEYNDKILTLAFAYQATRNKDYALLAYDMAVSMGKWEHWGPAYFLSLADAVTPYALAYDWLYNVWSENGRDLAPIETALYQHGILQGYYSSTGAACAFLSTQGDFSAYTTATDSWNVIGTSAMVIGSLALLGVGYNIEAEGRSGEHYTALYETYSKWLIENNLKNLTEIGLDMYAPDGSFLHSPSYWSYATNSLCLMSWALNTSAGDDFGLMGTWGMDKTFYYAYQTEYSMSTLIVPEGYQYWAYHDAPIGYQSTEMSFYAASALGDTDLAALRLGQLGKKPATMWDALAYDASYAALSSAAVNMPLDYVLESCEGIVSRSSWEDGALFVGIMGNRNDAVGGQVDSGNFVYVNEGFNWICDLGAESYGVKDYSDDTKRYEYYRMNGDGANVVIITSNNSMSAGQVLQSGGTLTDYAYNEHGMYAVIDNTDVYSGAVNVATRGLLFTNDRTTVVVQDYLSFSKVTSCAWVVHTAASNIMLSTDEKTAFIEQEIDGVKYYLRASLVTESTTLKFSVSDAYKTLLSSTRTSTSNEDSYRDELSRDGYKKLYINCKDAISFECAVVFEMISSVASVMPVQYNYTSFDSWNENLLTDTYVAPEVNEYQRTTPFPDDIITYTAKAAQIYGNGYAFSTKVVDFYRNMVYSAACVKDYLPTGHFSEKEERENSYKEYLVYRSLFDLFRNELNSYVSANEVISINLSGYTVSN